MLNIIESFSGIGSQAKALRNLNVEHRILATIEWDINAIIAYDLIHNGIQDLTPYINMSKNQLVKVLEKFTLSPDGKEAYIPGVLRRLDIGLLRKILCAIERTHDLVSITDVHSVDLPDEIDVFTYSFPCQDLSIAGVWHGNMTGIDRDANNRSGMLWEVERILMERVEESRPLPKFLLMENVKNIQAPRHKGNFDEWIGYLGSIGYYNKVYCLNARDFGLPQNRERVYMLSVLINDDNKNMVENYFNVHDLESDQYLEQLNIQNVTMENILRTDYKNDIYRDEANSNQIHDTPSRRKIIEDNDKILQDGRYIEFIKTITTKQDRNPNSGVIQYQNNRDGYLNYRYLTPRECFLAMGFDEMDFQVLKDNDFSVNKSRTFFSNSKLIKMAGNSIVVKVLEAIFTQVVEISDMIGYRHD